MLDPEDEPKEDKRFTWEEIHESDFEYRFKRNGYGKRREEQLFEPFLFISLTFLFFILFFAIARLLNPGPSAAAIVYAGPEIPPDATMQIRTLNFCRGCDEDELDYGAWDLFIKSIKGEQCGDTLTDQQTACIIESHELEHRMWVAYYGPEYILQEQE